MSLLDGQSIYRRGDVVFGLLKHIVETSWHMETLGDIGQGFANSKFKMS